MIAICSGGAGGFVRGRDTFGTTCGLDSRGAHSLHAPPNSSSTAAYGGPLSPVLVPLPPCPEQPGSTPNLPPCV